MVLANECFTPLSQVNGMDPRIRLHVNLPAWFPADEIGLHVPKAARLASLGGLRHVAFKTVRFDDDVSVVGAIVNTDGSLTATRAKSASRSVTQSTLGDLSSGGYFTNSRWRDATVGVDFESIRRQMMDANIPIANSFAWAARLDTAFRTGLRDVGIKHLWSEVEPVRKFAPYLPVAMLASGLFAGAHLSVKTPEETLVGAASGVFFYSAAANSIFTNMYGIPEPLEGRGYRVSLLPGIEFERTLAMQLKTRIPGSLVRRIQA